MPHVTSPPGLYFFTPLSELIVPCACPPTGSPWFKVRRVSKEDYKEALERNRADEATGDDGKLSPKDKIDSAW